MIKLKVTGMTCGHCEAAVTKALAAIANVERVVEVSREKQLAVVEGQADAQTLISAVTEAGYAAELAA